MSPQSILLFLVTLSVLVVLHEYGHFIVARLNGVRVTDFALGMGPTLAKWTSKTFRKKPCSTFWAAAIARWTCCRTPRPRCSAGCRGGGRASRRFAILYTTT